MDQQILIIEDSATCQAIAHATLKHLGDIQVASTCLQAHQVLEKQHFELVLIDIHLPDGNGLELYNKIKNNNYCNQTAFIFISGETDIATKVTAFTLGACDYLVKPYSPLELRARAERHLKSFQYGHDEVFIRSEISLNQSTYRASFIKDNKSIDLKLTPHEFKILSLLIKRPEQIFTRDQIINYAWGHDVVVSQRTVDVHVSTLRKKLGTHSHFVVSVRSEGYKWQEIS